jgi:hypothetical protein
VHLFPEALSNDAIRELYFQSVLRCGVPDAALQWNLRVITQGSETAADQTLQQDTEKEQESRLNQSGRHSDMLRSARPRPVAGFSIRSSQSLRPALVPIQAIHSQTRSDVLPLASTRDFGSSHLQFIKPAQLRTISHTPNRQQTSPDDMAEPTGLIAKSGIELLTFGL